MMLGGRPFGPPFEFLDPLHRRVDKLSAIRGSEKAKSFDIELITLQAPILKTPRQGERRQGE
jgi:hypothetical protein